MKKYKTFAIILSVLVLLTAAGCKNKRTSTPVTPDNGVPETEIVVFLRDHIHEYVDHYESFKIMDTNHSVQRVIDQGTQYIVDYLDLYFDVFTEKEIVKMYNSSIVIREEDENKWNWTNYHFEKKSSVGRETEEPEPQPSAGVSETAEATPEPDVPVTDTNLSTFDTLILSDGAPVLSSDDLELFDIVTFGRYQQKDEGDPEPIEWYVVKKEDDAIVLVSVKVLDSRPFHSNISTLIKYHNSDLFHWLQNEFKDAAFTEEEKGFICSDIDLIDRTYTKVMADKDLLKDAVTEYAYSNSNNKKITECWYIDMYYINLTDTKFYAIRDDGKEVYHPANTYGIGVRPMIKIRNW